MKLVRCLALLGLAAGLACTGAVLAQPWQDAAPAGSQTAANGMRRMPDPQHQLARLARKLQLTPDQAARIAPILQNRQQQMQQLRADTTLAPRERRARMRSIMQNSSSQLQSILSDSQQRQYQQMMQQAMQRRQDKKAAPQDDAGGE